MESPVVALFDVDGTLIRTEGPSRHSRAFKAAFQRIYGGECRFLPGMHGMTDRQIFSVLARHMNLGNGNTEELALEACRTMVELYGVAEETDGRYVALPGVRSTLDALAGLGVALGLVTGNAPEIARDKLASVELAGYFRFGAFGTEADNRSGLPPLAVARAEETLGARLDLRRVFVVGDTPRDVACALDNGLRAVAVGTGFVSLEELHAAGPELVLPDLQELGPLLRLMGLE